MPVDVTVNTNRSPVARSRVSNRKGACLFGDGRSAGARRLRDLIAAFGDECGGFDGLPVSGQALVRRLAQTCVELELLEARRATGEEIDPVAYGTLTNVQLRLARGFEKLRGRMKPRRNGLADHIERTYGAREGATSNPAGNADISADQPAASHPKAGAPRVGVAAGPGFREAPA